MKRTKARLFAFYLPQFHPIPENDAAWGKGFTEWTNVAKAKPLFEGHYQPHLPANLGFYDLRVPATRLAQADLARKYGIEGFCYWHYWFHGRQLLEQPFQRVLASGEPDFPFCLAWANETWSRRWLGEDKEVLVKQTYSADDDLQHIRWLMNAFSDPRYIRINGRPLFLIYRPLDLPDPWRTTKLFRSECKRHGIAEPFLLGTNSFRDVDYRQYGFDGTLNFEPLLHVVPDAFGQGLKTCDYTTARRQMGNHDRDSSCFRTVFVAWDNTPRRAENGVVFLNSSPEAFEAGLSETVQSVLSRPYEDRVVFINAWNEWAEGNHLEPDQKYGLGFLEVVRRVNCPAEEPQYLRGT